MEDTAVKKFIANIKIGLLEKLFNRRQQSTIFESLDECRHYQAMYGGQINMIHNRLSDPEITLEDEEPIQQQPLQEEDPLYVLTLKNQAILEKGSRYIQSFFYNTTTFLCINHTKS